MKNYCNAIMFRGLVTDIFFDLDHTLWDFETNSRLAFEKILPEHGLNVDLEAFLSIYRPLNKKYWKLYREEKVTKEALRYQRLKQCFEKLGASVPAKTIHALAQAYIANLSNFGQLMPHTVEILNYLRPNYTLHIITNGFHEIQKKKLKNSSIDSFFEHVIDAERAGVKKPNPVIFSLALKTAGVSPQKALMVGDDLEADVLGARALGMRSLHYDHNKEASHPFGPIIATLNEIKNFL